MFTYFYALEKFTKAVYYLATGKGDVRSRLLSAFRDPLLMITVEKLPTRYREEWLEIERILSKYREFRPGQLEEIEKRRTLFPSAWHPSNPDPLEATLKRITNETGSKVARKIYEIASGLEGLCRDDGRKHTSGAIPEPPLAGQSR